MIRISILLSILCYGVFTKGQDGIPELNTGSDIGDRGCYVIVYYKDGYKGNYYSMIYGNDDTSGDTFKLYKKKGVSGGGYETWNTLYIEYNPTTGDVNLERIYKTIGHICTFDTVTEITVRGNDYLIVRIPSNSWKGAIQQFDGWSKGGNRARHCLAMYYPNPEKEVEPTEFDLVVFGHPLNEAAYKTIDNSDLVALGHRLNEAAYKTIDNVIQLNKKKFNPIPLDDFEGDVRLDWGNDSDEVAIFKSDASENAPHHLYVHKKYLEKPCAKIERNQYLIPVHKFTGTVQDLLYEGVEIPFGSEALMKGFEPEGYLILLDTGFEKNDYWPLSGLELYEKIVRLQTEPDLLSDGFNNVKDSLELPRDRNCYVLAPGGNGEAFKTLLGEEDNIKYLGNWFFKALEYQPALKQMYNASEIAGDREMAYYERRDDVNIQDHWYRDHGKTEEMIKQQAIHYAAVNSREYSVDMWRKPKRSYLDGEWFSLCRSGLNVAYRYAAPVISELSDENLMGPQGHDDEYDEYMRQHDQAWLDSLSAEKRAEEEARAEAQRQAEQIYNDAVDELDAQVVSNTIDGGYIVPLTTTQAYIIQKKLDVDEDVSDMVQKQIDYIVDNREDAFFTPVPGRESCGINIFITLNEDEVGLGLAAYELNGTRSHSYDHIILMREKKVVDDNLVDLEWENTEHYIEPKGDVYMIFGFEIGTVGISVEGSNFCLGEADDVRHNVYNLIEVEDSVPVLGDEVVGYWMKITNSVLKRELE